VSAGYERGVIGNYDLRGSFGVSGYMGVYGRDYVECGVSIGIQVERL